MIVKTFYPGWEQKGSVLAYPSGWQRPAKTEEWAYEQCMRDLPQNRHVQMLCFPWATLIDLQRKGIRNHAQKYLEALRWTPPKNTLLRATVMQHIYAKDMLPILEQLGITDIFWSHATKHETTVRKIRIHPFPLFPVCCTGLQESNDWIALQDRRYLYSFIGAYESGLYLSEARRWIFELQPRKDTIIERRNEWHFESSVYRSLTHGVSDTEMETQVLRKREEQYKNILSQSKFSLCPSGSGPNTIRLWESIHMGAIPIIISDNCRLPGEFSLWDKATLRVPETRKSIKEIPFILEELMLDQSALNKYRQALTELAKHFSLEKFPPVIKEFFESKWKQIRCAQI